MTLPRPVIIGCRTDNFTKEQLDIFAKLNPFGMIIFAEPCEKGKDAVRHVVDQFRRAVGRADAPVLIDNEGGRVNRFKPEFGHGWRNVPAPEVFANLAQHDIEKAKHAVFLNAQLIAHDMRDVGVTVNCAPVVDVFTSDTFSGRGDEEGLHAASGDLKSRMFGKNIKTVTALGRAYCDGLMDQGVIPVIKHIPGYGRVKADPHYTITQVDHSLEELDAQDFVPFRELSDMPCAMTGHVLYTAIDPEMASTISPRVMQIIREQIGFKNIIMTDAIEMNAIAPDLFQENARDQFGMRLPKDGTIGLLTRKALEAGCDLVLHCDCSRDFKHTIEALEASEPMSEAAYHHVSNLMHCPEKKPFNVSEALTKLDGLLKQVQPT